MSKDKFFKIKEKEFTIDFFFLDSYLFSTDV